MKEKLRHCSLILKTHQTFHSQSQSVKMIFVFQDQSGILEWFLMTSSPWNNKLVKYVSPPTWNCVELAQFDMSLQLMLPKPLWHILVLSRLDYCNFLLSGIPQQLIDKLQKVQNCSARLIFITLNCTHVSTLLAKLYWLPITQKIDY